MWNMWETSVSHWPAGLYQVWISNWQLLDTGGTANSCFTYVANFTHMFCFMCHLCFNYIPFMFRLRSTYVSFMFHICFYLRLDIVYVYVMPRPPSIETIPGAHLDQAKPCRKVVWTWGSRVPQNPMITIFPTDSKGWFVWGGFPLKIIFNHQNQS